MRIEKEKYRIIIVCRDGAFVRGYIHINPGERIIDFMNDSKESFIAVTDAEFQNAKPVHSFKLHTHLMKKKGTILILKNAIRWIEGI